MKPVTLFLAPRHGTAPDIRLIDPEGRKAAHTRRVLFKRLPKDFSLEHIFTDNVQDADFVLIPQAIRKVNSEVLEYVRGVRNEARAYALPVLVFIAGDLCHREHIDLEGVVVFKGSEYAGARKSNEIVFAPFVEDLGELNPAFVRPYAELPVVSFCGYAGFPALRTHIKYVCTNLAIDMLSLINRNVQVYKRGIFFRRKALHVLSKDSRLLHHFILRDSYSGNIDTAQHDPLVLRAEYIQNILQSDFVLAPKGDANFSSRFYETLSLGRIPVLIDTGMVLPFADAVSYEQICVRVPHTKLHEAADYIVRWYQRKGEQGYRTAQKEARKAFDTHLRYDRYFNRALPLLRDGGIKSVLTGI